MKTKYIILILCVLVLSCKEEPEKRFGEPMSEEYRQSVQPLLDIMNMERPEDSYNYQVLRGSTEMKEMEPEKRHEACQVPKDILPLMSTQAVIQAIWEYPRAEPCAISSFRYHICSDYFFRNNNAYQELCKRDDAGYCIYSRVVLIDPWPVEISWPQLAQQNLLTIMSQPQFLEQLGTDEISNLIDFLIRKTETVDWDFWIGPPREDSLITCWTIGNALLSQDYQPFKDTLYQNDTWYRSLKDPEFEYYPWQFEDESFRQYGCNWYDVLQVIFDYGREFLTNKKENDEN